MIWFAIIAYLMLGLGTVVYDLRTSRYREDTATLALLALFWPIAWVIMVFDGFCDWVRDL